jgi:carbon storage regulator
MLVLTRKLLEKLYIGDDICVTVVRLEGGQVRLGIEAPRNVTVVRAELVSERPGPRLRNGPPVAACTRNAQAPAAVRCSPSGAHGDDIRRRGRFR